MQLYTTIYPMSSVFTIKTNGVDALTDHLLKSMRHKMLARPTEKQKESLPPIEDVIFNNPATIVKWSDGTKTVVKCGKYDTYSKEVGLAMAICKKAFGNNGKYNDILKKWIKE